MKQIKIGVLGGIGPEASAIFYLELIKELQHQGLIKSNQDFPQIFINSIPAPELIFDKVNDADLNMYIKGLEELDKINPEFIVMVCNTIHLYHQKLQSKITTEIVDLRKEVYQKINNLEIKTITVFGTPRTITQGLYHFEGICYLNPNEEEIRELSQAIFYFNQGIEKEFQKKKVEGIARKYLSQGSQAILLGCTEFAVMLDDIDIPKLNTIRLLVESVIQRYKFFNSKQSITSNKITEI